MSQGTCFNWCCSRLLRTSNAEPTLRVFLAEKFGEAELFDDFSEQFINTRRGFTRSQSQRSSLGSVFDLESLRKTLMSLIVFSVFLEHNLYLTNKVLSGNVSECWLFFFKTLPRGSLTVLLAFGNPCTHLLHVPGK